LKFDHLSGDGPLSLVFEASKAQQDRARVRPAAGKVAFFGSLPPLYLASTSLPAEWLMFIYPAMVIPAIYSAYDSRKASKEYKDLVKRMFLLKNGE